MKNSNHLSVFRYLTMILLVLLGMGAILAVLKGMIEVVGILVAVAVVVSLLWKYISTRCPACKKGFCMKIISREALGEEDVEIRENLNAWNAYDKSYQSGNVTTSASCKTYKETAKCRRCGHTEVSTRTVNLRK